MYHNMREAWTLEVILAINLKMIALHINFCFDIFASSGRTKKIMLRIS